MLGLILLAVFYFSVKNLHQTNQQLLSPLADSGRVAVNLWFPKINKAVSNDDAPNITARGAYFVDVDNGDVLYQKNQNQKFPIASLTKIMTVIVTLENHKFEDNILISEEAAKMEPDHMELIAGETLSVEDLLYGVFLVSANDGAEALAQSLPGGRDGFISKMNKEAVRLGMNDTLFINPTGLEEDDREQYSTAYDVALMSRFATKNFPHIVDISSTPHIILPKTDSHQDYDLYSGINLLTTYPGVVGFKTGYTPEAGLTLVTLAKRGGHTVLGVLLGSQDRRDEARELLDYSFKKLGVQI